MKLKQFHIQLTQRDMAILSFINDFGFCEMQHLERRFGMKKPIGYRLMRRLIKAGLVVHERIYHFEPGIYFLTPEGAKCTSLPPISHFAIGRYAHQKALIDVYLTLRECFPNTKWLSERQLKHEKFFDGIGKYGHLADGVLAFPDGRNIAIEVELNLKGKERTKQIFKQYAAQFSFHEIWYFCPKEMAANLNSLAKNMPFIKIYHFEENLHEQLA